MANHRAPQKYDWARIEAEYRTGMFTDAELCRRHGCGRSVMQRRAKREGWQRDLTHAVALATRVKLSNRKAKIDIPEGGIPEGQETIFARPPRTAGSEKEIIDSAANVRVQLIEGHRVELARLRRLEQQLLAELGDQDQPPLKVHITSYQGRVTQTLLGLTVPERTGSLQQLSQVMAKRIEMERQAYGLDADDGGELKSKSTEELLQRAEFLMGVIKSQLQPSA